MIVKVKLQGSDVTKAVIADSLKTLKVKGDLILVCFCS